jgi:hypothetical protein
MYSALLSVFAVGAAAQYTGQICYPDEYSMDRHAWHSNKAEYDRTQIWFSHSQQKYRFRDQILTDQPHFLDLIYDVPAKKVYEIYDRANSITCQAKALPSDFELPHPCISNLTQWQEETVGANLIVHHRYGQRFWGPNPTVPVNFNVHYTHVTHVPVFISEWITFPNGTRHHEANFYTNFGERVDPGSFTPPSFCPPSTEEVNDEVNARFKNFPFLI